MPGNKKKHGQEDTITVRTVGASTTVTLAAQLTYLAVAILPVFFIVGKSACSIPSVILLLVFTSTIFDYAALHNLHSLNFIRHKTGSAH